MSKVLVAKPEDISLNFNLSSKALQAHAWVGGAVHVNNPGTGKAETGKSQKLAGQQICELQI